MGFAVPLARSFVAFCCVFIVDKGITASVSDGFSTPNALLLTSKEDGTYEYSFSMFLPPDFPIVPTRLVIAQWKQCCPDNHPCSDDSPVLAMRYSNGVLRITQDLRGQRTILYQKRGDLRKAWLDFRFRVRFRRRQQGASKHGSETNRLWSSKASLPTRRRYYRLSNTQLLLLQNGTLP
jgi:hypothetical protein